MGKIRSTPPVKLIVGFIYHQEKYPLAAQKILIKHFGPVDFTSRPLAFGYTDYYQKEFGADLKKSFICFKKLINPVAIAKVKHLCNRIEEKLSGGATGRLINIDPGYLTLAKFVLATTKDYSHRIYLNRGIYAEITLSYKKNSFCSLPWTYPDYGSAEYIAIFNQIREIYHRQIL